MSRTLRYSSVMLMLISLCSKYFLNSEMFAMSCISTNVSALRSTPYITKSSSQCHYPLSFSLPSYLNYKAPSHPSSSHRLSSTSPPHNLSTTPCSTHLTLINRHLFSLLLITANCHYATQLQSKSSRLPHASLSQLIFILQPSIHH